VDLSGHGKFCRFLETISPDGAFILAYGRRGAGSPNEFDDISETRKTFSRDQEENGMTDYLVDAKKGHVLTRIPGFSYFLGQGRHHLEVAWSMDSRRAVAMDRGRWANGHSAEAVVYIDPQSQEFTPILKEMNEAVARYATGHLKAAVGKDYAYFDPVMLDDHTLSMEVCEGLVIGAVAFDYRINFAVRVENGQAMVRVKSGRPNPEQDLDVDSYNAFREEDDANLRWLCRRLRPKLDPRERRCLAEAQARWLRYRATVENYVNTDEMTRKRLLELRLLLAERKARTKPE